MKRIEDQALEYAEALNDIADVLDMPTGATSIDIVNKARNRWADGIHTCDDKCDREWCVARREMKFMRDALERIRDYQGRFGEDDPQSIAADVLARIFPPNAKRTYGGDNE